ARCNDIEASLRHWGERGVDRGAATSASRETSQGLLRWRISVRDDGARLFDGALPTLIEWRDVHPADAMPASGVVLDSLQLGGLPETLQPLLAIDGVSTRSAGPALEARFTTSQGRVVSLQSPSLQTR
ncbi:MAG TPA: VOC family protein, partial [Albitalea sp.]|nr:VOC family protein [Albitalea sp.]